MLRVITLDTLSELLDEGVVFESTFALSAILALQTTGGIFWRVKFTGMPAVLFQIERQKFRIES